MEHINLDQLKAEDISRRDGRRADGLVHVHRRPRGLWGDVRGVQNVLRRSDEEPVRWRGAGGLWIIRRWSDATCCAGPLRASWYAQAKEKDAGAASLLQLCAQLLRARIDLADVGALPWRESHPVEYMGENLIDAARTRRIDGGCRRRRRAVRSAGHAAGRAC